MANPLIPESFRGLVLSAADLRQLTGWPDPLIEDYLNIYNNLLTLANIVNQKNDIVKIVTNVEFADSPYDIVDSNDIEEIVFDTTDGDIVANLPAGSEGRNYRLINGGKVGNKVTLNPSGTENLFGENEPEYIYDLEALIVTFDDLLGWM